MRGDVLQIKLTADRPFLPYDNSLPTIIYSPQLTDQEIESITQDLEQQRRFFYDRFGVSARGLAIYYGAHLEADTGRPLGVSGWAGKHSMWISGTGLFAHEYFHVLQSQLGRSGGAPSWLVEGTAQYAQWTFHYAGTDLELRHIEQYLFALREDPARASIRLTDSHSYDSSDAWVRYSLGEVAAHWLSDHAGESAIIELWRWSPEGRSWSWEAAFEHAFGISVPEFATRFGAYLGELNAQAAALPALIAISGRITRPDGEPVAGQLVDILVEAASDVSRWRPVRTDSEGRFEKRLESGDYSIRLRTDEFETIGYYSTSSQTGHTVSYHQRTVFNSADVPDISVRLPEVHTIRVRVVGPEGHSAAGQRVEIVFEQPGGRERHIPQRTDSAGRVNRSVSAGNYSIRLRTDAFQTIGYLRLGVAGNFTTSEDERTVFGAGDFETVEIQIPGVTLDPIRVTVTQPDGSAAVGVWVSICAVGGGDCQQGPVDDSGIRTVSVLRNDYIVSFSVDGTHVGYYSASSQTGHTVSYYQRTVFNSADVPDISVRLPEVHTISVRVVGPEGRPAAGQRVEIVFEQPGERASHIPLLTDSDGRVNRSVSAGNYSIGLLTDAFQAIGYLRVGVAGNFTTSEDERTVFGAGDFETVEIQIPGVTLDPIRVTVTQPDGSAAIGVWVAFCEVGGGDCQQGPVDDSGIRTVSVLRNDYIVRFSVDGSHVGYYSAASQTGLTDTYQQRTVFNSGEVPDISVRLPEVHTISVRVVGPEGRPATGQRVEIVFEQPGERASHIPLRTDSDGRVNRSVAAGNYSIRLATDAFQAIGYLRLGVAGNFTTSDDERTVFGAADFEAVEIQIPGVMLDPIRVTVTQPDGSAATGVWVSICAVGGGDCQEGPVDDSGIRTVSVLRNDYIVSFSVDGTHVGYYSASSQTGHTVSYYQRTVFNSSDVPDISVRLPEVHTFSVRVVGPDGNPAVGQRVDLVFERPGEGESYRPVRTDSEGRFEDSIVAGSYSIRLPTAASQTIGYFRTGVSGSFTKSGDDRTVFEAGSFRTVQIVLPRVTLDPIRVTVTYADGSAATGVWVSVCVPSGVDCASGQIDDSGSRTISVLRNDYTVSFSFDGTPLGYYRAGSQTGHTDRYQQRTVINSADVHEIAVRLPANR